MIKIISNVVPSLPFLTAVGADLTKDISNLGFPIVMCLILAFYIQKDGKANREQVGKLADALNNNTLVITRLLERLEKDNE